MDIKQENNSGSNSLIEERVDAKLFFSGAQRRRVLEEIKGCILDGVSIITLTGEEGTGKSVICKMVEKELPADYTGVYLPDTLESFDDVVRLVAVMLGTESSDKPDSLSSLVLEIINNLKATDRRLVLIFDQAERMFLATIERIRKMLDLVNRDEERLQIIFSGRKTLLDNLKQLKICDFSKVYERNFVLHPLGLSETYAYLNHCARKKTKPHLKNVFTPELAKRIFNMAQGNLRMTNVLAMKALDLAESRKSIADLLDSVTEDPQTPPKTTRRKKQQKQSSLVKRLAFIALGGGLLGAVFFYFSADDGTKQQLPSEKPSVAEKEVDTPQPEVAEVKVEPEPLEVEEEAVEENKIIEKDLTASDASLAVPEDKKVPMDVPPQETELHQDALFDPDGTTASKDATRTETKKTGQDSPIKKENQEKTVLSDQKAADNQGPEPGEVVEASDEGQALTDPLEDSGQTTETAVTEIQQIYATKSKTVFVPIDIPAEDESDGLTSSQEETAADSETQSSPEAQVADGGESSQVQETTDSIPVEQEGLADGPPVSLSPLATKKIRPKQEIGEITSPGEELSQPSPDEPLANTSGAETGVVELSTDKNEVVEPPETGNLSQENLSQDQPSEDQVNPEQKGVRIIAEMNKKPPEDGVAADSKQLSKIAPVKFNEESDSSPAPGFGEPMEQDGDLFQKRLSAGSTWLETKKPGKHTVQLMALSTAKAEENLRERFQQQEYQDIADKLYILKNGKYKVFVYYGEYPDLDSARQARNTLPLFLRKYDPYAVSIQEAVDKAGSEKSQ